MDIVYIVAQSTQSRLDGRSAQIGMLQNLSAGASIIARIVRITFASACFMQDHHETCNANVHNAAAIPRYCKRPAADRTYSFDDQVQKSKLVCNYCNMLSTAVQICRRLRRR